eukprot:6413922-Karenia_brevis.AAC.1
MEIRAVDSRLDRQNREQELLQERLALLESRFEKQEKTIEEASVSRPVVDSMYDRVPNPAVVRINVSRNATKSNISALLEEKLEHIAGSNWEILSKTEIAKDFTLCFTGLPKQAESRASTFRSSLRKGP